MIDNSSAFRMDPHVPLVIPEINAEDVRQHRGLIANPNCTTAITLMALYPLHRVFGVRRIFAASYQAVSGSGARAIDELTQQIKSGEFATANSMPGSSAFAEATADKFIRTRSHSICCRTWIPFWKAVTPRRK